MERALERYLLRKVTKQRIRGHSDGTADLDKLYNLKAPFRTFIFRNKRLVSSKATRQPVLSQASGVSSIREAPQ
jgi:hypothetical protein